VNTHTYVHMRIKKHESLLSNIDRNRLSCHHCAQIPNLKFITLLMSSIDRYRINHTLEIFVKVANNWIQTKMHPSSLLALLRAKGIVNQYMAMVPCEFL
jgi:sulfatase maturation enzyme AslB (radical SAM superfamily)